ncbi:zinc finger protein 511 isoform X2 [Phycodurus eques]|uniref:zinc finger protein 511 isoform X2 n=1 Tax=Phycodurus eques TaxID=693459 RepID=UPI002ACE4104|nr:zinc finger protein 511 isoform X2 [Phycodurus eques]
MLQPETAPAPTPGDVLGKRYNEYCTSDIPQEETPFNFSPQLIYLHKDHELFEDGDVERHMYLQDLYISEADDDKQTLRNVCSICRRSLPTSRLLDIHIQEWHDSVFMVLAQRQDMYQCLVEGCEHKFRTITLRKDHLVQIHKYPPDFRFDKPKRERGPRETKQQPHMDTAMEVVDNASDVLCEEQSKQADQDESMELPVFTTEILFTEKGASHEGQAAGHKTNDEPLKPRYSYRVPSNVCFGHGSIRGFRGHKGRRK